MLIILCFKYLRRKPLIFQNKIWFWRYAIKETQVMATLLPGYTLLIHGPYDDDAKIKRIVAQLEKSAGPGNYTIVYAEVDNLWDAGEFEIEEISKDLQAVFDEDFA